jgi:hypothetical protein
MKWFAGRQYTIGKVKGNEALAVRHVGLVRSFLTTQR